MNWKMELNIPVIGKFFSLPPELGFNKDASCSIYQLRLWRWSIQQLVAWAHKSTAGITLGVLLPLIIANGSCRMMKNVLEMK